MARRGRPASASRRSRRPRRRGQRLAPRRCGRVMSPVVAVSAQKAMWFASRGTGVVCLLLLTASVVLGVITTVRFETLHWPRFVLEGLHRNVSLLILVFIVLHVVTTVVDGFVKIGYLDAVVPFHSPYRTFWLGLGT